jgi:hypothetical protein
MKLTDVMTQVSSKKIISFQGSLSFPIIEELLTSTKQKLDLMSLDIITYKRLYAILVECLENTVKHKIIITEDLKHSPLEMELKQTEGKFVLAVGNYIKKSSAEPLIQKIEEVNSMDRNGLNQLYRSSIAKARISDKGGAGLGIIDMARNSGQKIKYQFINEEQEMVFFIVEISLLNPPSNN